MCSIILRDVLGVVLIICLMTAGFGLGVLWELHTGGKGRAMNRDPYDGLPYYCALCGLGISEVISCDESECCLESKATAKARQLRRRPQTTAAQPVERT
jgi:hypothetical protein